MNFIDEAIDQYCVEHSEAEHPIFEKLRERTYAEMEIPQMLAGNLVGNFIQLMIRLADAKRVVEVGTFTGYSSLKMAQALPEDGEVITLEYEPKHAAFSVVQIHQLQHHLCRLRRSIEALVELSFQRGRFFIDGTGLRLVGR